jgi:hypothetical protein
MATIVELGESPKVELQTPGIKKVVSIALEHDFEVVELATPMVSPGFVLPDHGNDQFAPLVDLTCVTTLAPENPDYERKHFNGRLESMTSRLREDGVFGEFNFVRTPTFRTFMNRYIAGGLRGWEQFADTTGHRTLVPRPGVKLAQEEQSTASYAYLWHEINVYPDQTLARLALQAPQDKVLKKGASLEGSLLYPIRRNLLRGLHQ